MTSQFKKYSAIFFALLGVGFFFIKVYHKRLDFPCFYLAGQRFVHGENLYVINDQWPYKYLPSAAVFFSPLALFPENISLVLFYILSFLSLTLTYLLLTKITEKQKIAPHFFSMVLIFLINCKVHAYDFANLQINHFLVLFLVVSFALLEKNNEEKKSNKTLWISAFLFSLAGIFKIIPLFISLYYLLKKEFKYFFMTLITSALLLLLPVIRYGVSGLIEQYHNYSALMKNYHQLFSNDRLYQSLPAFIARLGDSFHFSENETLMKLILLLLLIPLGAIVLKMVWDQYKNKTNDSRLNWLEFSSCLIFYPLVNPVSWKHGYIFLVPVTFFLFTYIKEMKFYKLWSMRIGIMLFLILYVFSSQMIIGKRLSDNKDLLSFNVFAAIILLILAAICHRNILKTLTPKT